MTVKGLNGLKAVQFGLFLILLGFTVNIFAYGLFAVAVTSTLVSGAEGLELSAKLGAWGVLSLPVGWIVSALGKLLCAGAPEEKARTLIVASLFCDFAVLGAFYYMTTSLSGFLIGAISLFVLVITSYVTFLLFLGRMGDNIGEPRVTYYVSILLKLMWVAGGVSISVFFSPDIGGLTVNLVSLLGTLLFNYTVFVLFRGLPLYIEEVRAGITDPTESAEDRKEQERKERLAGGGPGGPSQAKPPEEPQGDPPKGAKLYRIPKGLEPLHMAVKEGDRYKTELRLAQGDDPRQAIRHGLTPLHLAASVGVMEVADALLKAGAPIDETCEMNLTPLFFAVQTGNHNLVGFLVNKGASLFHQNSEGYTPLHWACCAPHPNFIGPVRVKMVKLLISQGADVNALTNDGKTARDLALDNQLEETIACLERHMNVGAPPPKVFKSVRDEDGDIEETEGEPAAFPPFVGTELSVIPKDLTPLHDAVKEGEPEKVQRQLNMGATVHDALEGGIAPIHITAITGVMSVTELLLRYGAKIDDTYSHNLTAIYLAVHLNNYNMVGYLISRGANPNHKDEMGRTPLHWAAAAPHERLEGGNRVKMVQFLLDNGADPDVKDQNGQTPMDLAAAGGIDDIVTVFEDRRAASEEDDEDDDEGYYA